MATNTWFSGQPNDVLKFNPLDFYLRRNLKTLLYSVPIENEERLHQRNFYVCQSNLNHLGPFEIVRQSIIRRVHACVYSGRRDFEYLL